MNVAAGSSLHPLSVALVATVGATIGEMTSYVAGMVGRKVFLGKFAARYAQAETWMKKRGFVTVFVFALIPMFMFDLIGIVAGSTRYHVGRFVVATFAGRFLRCLLYAYLGYSLLSVFSCV